MPQSAHPARYSEAFQRKKIALMMKEVQDQPLALLSPKIPPAVSTG